MLADTPERMEWLKMAHARARYLGLETELLTVSEAKKLMPLIEERYFVGAMLDAADGNLDPSGTTHAYAKSARINGAEIFLSNRVPELEPRPRRRLGRRHRAGHHRRRACGELRRAVGARGRPHGRPRAAGARHGAHVPPDRRDAGGRWVQPRARPRDAARHRLQGRDLHAPGRNRGMLLGTYEKACVPWSPKATPWDFGNELLAPDLDRIAPSLEIGFQHFPAMARRRHQADHQRRLHLLARRQSAGRAGAGPQNFWCACAVMAGFSQGGGVGLALSQWMVERRSRLRRLGDGRGALRRMGDAAATPMPRSARIMPAASRIRFPNEELPAARPQQTTALYDMMIAQGAVMGDSAGGSRRRSGSRPRVSSRRTSSPSTAPTISRM